MKLNLLQRIKLLSVLPIEENIITLRIIRDLKHKLSFTENEIKEYEIIQNNNTINWNIKGNEEKEIEIGEKATDIIINSIKELNEKKKLTDEFIDIWDKFIK